MRQFWDTLAEYFWDIGSKVGSFVKYLLWHQNYFGMDYTLPIFRSTPLPLCLTCPLTCKFFQPPSPLLSILKSPYSPILCKLECPLSESFTRVSKGTIKQHRFAQCYFTDSKQRFNKQTGQQCLISCHGWNSCNCKKDLLIL